MQVDIPTLSSSAQIDRRSGSSGHSPLGSSRKAAEYVHQTNAYYGVFMPIKYAEYAPLFFTDTKWDGLVGDCAEVCIEFRRAKSMLSWSVNSEHTAPTFMSTHCFIFADDMTFEGPESPNPLTYINIEPSEYIRRERLFPHAINVVAELQTHLIKEFKRHKLPMDDLYCGWRIINCAWVNDNLVGSNGGSGILLSAMSAIKKLTSSDGRLAV